LLRLLLLLLLEQLVERFCTSLRVHKLYNALLFCLLLASPTTTRTPQHLWVLHLAKLACQTSSAQEQPGHSAKSTV